MNENEEQKRLKAFPVTKRKGRSFSICGRAFLSLGPSTTGKLVHGDILQGGERVELSWIEINGMIYDAVSNTFRDAATFITEFGARIMRQFNWLQAVEWVSKHGRFKPHKKVVRTP